MNIERVKDTLIGKLLDAVPTPSVIVDRAVAQRNCDQLLSACQLLGVKFRPHIKTHKTWEVTHLQLGKLKELNIIVSTVAEAEYVTGYLVKRKDEEGLSVNILYGLPIPPSQIERLASIGQKLGPGSISVLIDSVGQIPPLAHFCRITGWSIGAFVKIDTGYHRAGVQATFPNNSELHGILRLLFSKAVENTVNLHGLYSHAGHSYGQKSPDRGLELLVEEIKGLATAAEVVLKVAKESGVDETTLNLTLSVGATPTVTTIEHVVKEGRNGDLQVSIDALKLQLTRAIPQASLEFHAGCYPFLDVQQLATKASPSSASHSPKTLSDIGLTILAEVNSLYNDRKPPEAMIAAGTLAIGREPCQSYAGWGIVSDWVKGTETVGKHSGWTVGRISQEHGMLVISEVPSITDTVSSPMSLSVGQKVRVWPNHACIAGAGFDYYVVVDSSLPVGDEVVDVWTRCNGW